MQNIVSATSRVCIGNRSRACNRAVHTLIGKGNKRRQVSGERDVVQDDSIREPQHQQLQHQTRAAATSSTTTTVPMTAATTPGDEQSVLFTDSRRYSHSSAQAMPKNLPATSVTSFISELVSRASLEDLSAITVHRSKRMLLDTLGVGVIGSATEISRTVARTCTALEWQPEGMAAETGGGRDQVRASRLVNKVGAVLWGSRSSRTSPATAAFINGVSVHSMDLDDTWHPATHPSGPTLPAVLALAETSVGGASLQDILVAYNVGIQVQGLLLRSAQSAKSIPWRFHPPAIVGVMGSAAACSNLLGFGPEKCRAALGIAASFAGAPMANAGTTTKPLHTGKAARFGLEAALLADQGIEGNFDILDMSSGFGAFYDDFDPQALLQELSSQDEFLLHSQDIALKRFPAHLGMHWTIDATLAVRANIAEDASVPIDINDIQKVLVRAPPSKYINRPLPTSEHEARHSFQFNACTALLDGQVTPNAYHDSKRLRPELQNLLHKTEVVTPEDNHASFNEMYVEVHIFLKDGSALKGRCDTPYGHWRNPLSDQDVVKKFMRNTHALPHQNRLEVVKLVSDMSSSEKASSLTTLLYAY